MSNPTGSAVRCGIVLAGGEGKRLEPFIHRLRGKRLPKQFVNIIGSRSMLEHTWHRVEGLIPRDRLFTVVNQAHLVFPEVLRQLESRPEGTVVVQPENKETLPGLLLPLVHLTQHYPEAMVVVFPSDHFIVEEGLFMGHVDVACRVVERGFSDLVLLGIEPQEPEPEYGYILPGRRSADKATESVRRVVRFVEKPGDNLARELVRQGALWNSFVMVFRAQTLLELVHRLASALYESFDRIRRAIGTPGEQAVVKEVYGNLMPVNCSSQLLQDIPCRGAYRLSVLPVRGVFWSDWGSESRIASVLQKMDRFNRRSGSLT